MIGSVGLAEYPYFGNDCCELQKLYVDTAFQGRGLGYKLVRFIENKAREMGYRNRELVVLLFYIQLITSTHHRPIR